MIPIFFETYTNLEECKKSIYKKYFDNPGTPEDDPNLINIFYKYKNKDFSARAYFDVFMHVIAYFEKLKIDWINKYNDKYKSEEPSNPQFINIYNIINSLKDSSKTPVPPRTTPSESGADTSSTDTTVTISKDELLCFLYVLMGFEKVKSNIGNLDPSNDDLVTGSGTLTKITNKYIEFLKEYVFEGIAMSPGNLKKVEAIPEDKEPVTHAAAITDDAAANTDDAAAPAAAANSDKKYKQYNLPSDTTGDGKNITIRNNIINRLIKLSKYININDKINIKSLLTILKINNYFNKSGFVTTDNLKVTDPESTKYKRNLKRFSDGLINVAQIRILRLFTGQDIPNKYEGELEVAKLAEEIFDSSYILPENLKPCNQYKSIEPQGSAPVNTRRTGDD